VSGAYPLTPFVMKQSWPNSDQGRNLCIELRSDTSDTPELFHTTKGPLLRTSGNNSLGQGWTDPRQLFEIAERGLVQIEEPLTSRSIGSRCYWITA